jgi:high affinity Mn2+ porin
MTKHGGEGTTLGAAPKAYLTLCAGAFSLGVSCIAALDAHAEAKPASQLFQLDAQSTFVAQANAGFHSPYRGANSLGPAANARETWDLTFYVGIAPWRGGELWADPEIDQGFGLSNTLGVAGFPSGEAYKVGRASPYARLQRLFFRQTIAVGASAHTTGAALNQLAGEAASDRIILTLGKFSAADIFDANQYAHDPRGDFLNWSIIEAGTFDYAADAWGYSSGAAVEFYRGPIVVRVGDFNLSDAPNSIKLGHDFSQYQLVGELESDYGMAGRSGSVRVTAFASHGRMGRLRDAIALAQTEAQPADIATVRRLQTRTGISLDLAQALSDDLGFFLRAGWADGRFEAYEFSDIDRTLSVGLSLAGTRWRRPGDTLGAALALNAASRDRQDFLNAGGLGILVGDGKLPHPGPEAIAETYYDLAAMHGVHLSLDLQGVVNPGYNRDRGPVMFGGFRLHAATR